MLLKLCVCPFNLFFIKSIIFANFNEWKVNYFTSLAMSLEALAARMAMASLRRSYPFFLASSLACLYMFCVERRKVQKALKHLLENCGVTISMLPQKLWQQLLLFLKWWRRTHQTVVGFVCFGQLNVHGIGHEMNGGFIFLPRLYVRLL